MEISLVLVLRGREKSLDRRCEVCGGATAGEGGRRESISSNMIRLDCL